MAVGVLYILGTVAGGASQGVFWGPIHGAADSLLAVSASHGRVILGAAVWFCMGLFLSLIPVLAFPILRRHSEPLAVGYVVFRSALETITYALMSVGWLLLIPLSGFYKSGSSDAGIAQALGGWLLEANALSSCGTIFFCIGAFIFYWALFRYRLVPRWLSGWGLLAALPYLAGGVLGLIGAVNPSESAITYMDLPLAFQEMALAVWLIVKGFKTDAA